MLATAIPNNGTTGSNRGKIIQDRSEMGPEILVQIRGKFSSSGAPFGDIDPLLFWEPPIFDRTPPPSKIKLKKDGLFLHKS